MYTHFNPGCTLCLYKPVSVTKLFTYLRERYPDITMHDRCCHHEPEVGEDACIITVCTGCNRRFNTLYPGVSGRTVWEVIDADDSFPLPSYEGRSMSVHDPCPSRSRSHILDAVRSILTKMNITIVEAANSRDKAVCCGNSFYPTLPVEEVHRQMQRRASSMPCEDVAVYCVTCAKSIATGGKRPRYLLDLIFNEETAPSPLDTVAWRNAVAAYRDLH